jgi:hypothetical protein
MFVNMEHKSETILNEDEHMVCDPNATAHAESIGNQERQAFEERSFDVRTLLALLVSLLLTRWVSAVVINDQDQVTDFRRRWL